MPVPRSGWRWKVERDLRARMDRPVRAQGLLCASVFVRINRQTFVRAALSWPGLSRPSHAFGALNRLNPYWCCCGLSRSQHLVIYARGVDSRDKPAHDDLRARLCHLGAPFSGQYNRINPQLDAGFGLLMSRNTSGAASQPKTLWSPKAWESRLGDPLARGGSRVFSELRLMLGLSVALTPLFVFQPPEAGTSAAPSMT